MKQLKLSKKTKIIIISAAAFAAVILGLAGLRALLKADDSSKVTYSVKSETYENTIEIAGTVSAAEEQTLQAKGEGTVTGVYVKKGDKVKKGQVILQLDDTEQRYNLADINNQIETAKISGSKKQIELLETKKISILQKVNDRKVVASFDGIIADLDVSVEDYMEAKDSAGTLVNVDYLIAEVEIAETDVSNLKVGQKVIMSFPAYKQNTVEGVVISWPAIGEVTSRGATVVKAKVRIDNYPEQILPNYSFTGKIQITEPEDLLIVDTNAVGRKDGKSFVQLASNGEKIEVKVRPYASGYFQIVEGELKGGEELKAQGTPKVSGSKKNNMPGMGGMNGSKSGNNRNGPPMGGMPPM